MKARKKTSGKTGSKASQKATVKRRSGRTGLESPDKYQQLVELTNTGFVILNEKGKVLDANHEYVRMTGHESLEEILGRPVTDWTAIYDRDRNEAEVRKCLATGSVRNLVVDYVHASGTVVAVEINATVQLGPGRPRILTVCRDVSERKRSEEALRTSEKRYRELYTQTPVMLHSIDHHGRLVSVSDEWLRRMGYARDEVLGRRSTEFLTEASRTYAQETVLPEFFRTGQCSNVPYQFVTKSGRVLHVLLSAIAERDASGAVVRSLAVIEDVSEQRESAEALRQSEEKFRLLVETTYDWIWEVDSSGVYTYASPRVRDLLGYTPGEIVGKTPFDLMPLDEQERVSERFRDLVRKREPLVGLENANLHKDGRRIVLETSGLPIFDNAGEFKGYRGVDRDITERKRAEELLRESEERLRLAVYSGNIGTWEWELVTGKLEWNDQLKDIFGLPADIADLNLDKFIATIHPEDRAETERAFRTALNEHKDFKHEYRIVIPDGRTRWIEAVGRGIYDNAGLPVRMLGCALNITERKQAEEALRTSEGRTRSIIDSIPVGMHMYRLEPGGRLVFTGANPAADRILGVDNRSFIGKTIEDAFPPLAATEVPRRYREVVETGQPWQTESIEYKDNVIAGAFDVYAFRTGPDSMVAAFEVITERKRAEMAVRESEAKYRLVVENAGEGILVVQDGMLKFANPWVFALGGYDAEDVLNKPFARFIHPEDRAFVGQQHLRRMNGEIPADHVYDFRILTKSGDVLWVEMKGAVSTWEGKPASVNFIFNITERKRAEMAVRESEAKYRRLYNETPIMLHSIDRNAVLVDVNDHWLKVMGYTRDEVIGRVVTDFYAPASVKFANEVVQPAFFRDGIAKDIRYQFVKKNGEIIDVLLSATGERDAEGRVIRSLAVVEDITERERTAAELRQNEARMTSLFRISQQSVEDEQAFLDLALNEAIALTGSMIGYLYFYNEAKREFTLNSYSKDVMRECSIGDVKTCYELDKTGIWGEAVRQRRPIMLNDFEAGHPLKKGYPSGHARLRKFLTIPVIMEGAAVAVVGVANKTDDYTDADVTQLNLLMDSVWKMIQRARAEEALRKSERLLQTIFDAEPECVKLLDENSNLIMMNRAGLDMIQADSLEQVRGQCVCPMIESRDRDAFMDLIRRVFRGEAGKLLFEIVGLRGRHLWLETYTVPLRDEKDRITAALGVTRDVTERRHAEESLRESEERFRDLAETLPLTVFEADLLGRFTYVNRAALQTFGYTQEDVAAGLSIPQVIAPEDRNRASANMVRRIAGFSDGYLEYLGMRKDGTTFPITVASNPVIRDGVPVGLRGIVTDLTQQRELDEERLKTDKLESIGTLAGGIAHDFNNLLQGVFGFISMARLTYDNRERSLAMLEKAEQALHQSVSLATQLLTFSKGGKPVKKPVAVLPIVESACRFALSGSRTVCRVDADQDLWSIDADEGQINQVIQNIVLNADQAMPLGGMVTVRARNVPAAGTPETGHDERRRVEISIHDNGVGIPQEYLSKIFDPYFTTKDKGSGLGLATSYSIIKNHGGMITVSSDPGKGTTFSIVLPAIDQLPEQLPRTEVLSVTRSGRVLVMDDEEVIRAVAIELIRSMGHEVEVAENGEQAIKLFQKARAAARPYDVVILDLTVRGGMGGAEALLRLREIDPGIRAVVSSGYSDETVMANFREHGFNASLKKPYDRSALQTVLHSLISETAENEQ